jgi:hypothetical protein
MPHENLTIVDTRVESAESRVARGLHPEPGPHCVECGKCLTEAEATAQVPDCDEVCDACEATPENP